MAHEGLWEQLAGLDGEETAKRAKCRYTGGPERYTITMLNTEYEVNLSEKRIFSIQPGASPVQAKFLEQLCILAYLINAKDLPPAKKLVKAETLPGGQFFFRGPHSLPTDKLETAFSSSPEKLCGIAERFEAKRCEFGDASIELYVLPRLPITIVVWGSCDEFPARASILFDQTACEQLPLDALLAAVNSAVSAIVSLAAGDG